MLTAISSEAVAQQNTLSGSVVDATTGEALIGATVIALEGDVQSGTMTDLDGRFSLKITGEVENIEVSYVGYATQRIAVGAKSNIAVALQTGELLDEVVVVGYGKIRKSDVTGSISSIAVDEIEASSSSSIQSILQGRAAGVQVTSGDGAPGSAVNIKIRGTSSLTGGSEPLYVVDGIMMNSASQDVSMKGEGGNNNYTQGQNGLAGISPQDIANIEILKDASATAIYGSQGANGVVLITTKQGVSERTAVQYNGSVTASIMANKREMIGLEDYAIFKSDFDGEPYSIEGLSPIDWQDEISRTVISHNHSVSVSGKNDKTNYYFSTGMVDNQGIIKGTSVEQINLRLNLDHNIASWAKIGTKSSFTSSNNSMVQGSDTRGNSNSGLIRQSIVFKPFDPTIGEVLDDEMLDENGNPIKDPRAWLTDYDDSSREYRALSTFYLDVDLLKSLNMRTSIGLDYRNKKRDIFFGTKLFQGEASNGIAESASLEVLGINVDHMFNYTETFGRHRLSATAGVSLSTTRSRTNNIATSQLGGVLDYGTGGLLYGTTDEPIYYSGTDVSTLSGLARVIYSYDDRYVLTSTFRADGSSKFAPGNKFSYFPSLALAYRINEEAFLKDVEQISDLKLRLGWGMVGNQAITPYQTLTTFSNGQYNNPNGGYDLSIFRDGLPNQDLRWETTTTYNIGLDVGLYDNRFTLAVDAYQKITSDLLQNINISSITGYKTMYINRGEIENKGVEVSFDARVVETKDFSFGVSGNISMNRNKILDIGLDQSKFGNHTLAAMTGDAIGAGNYLKDYVNIYAEGYATGLFFGNKVDGILQQSDIDRMTADGTLPTFNGQYLVAGDPNYVDVNGDGVIDSQDETFIGDPNPDFSYGFSLDFEYKNFFVKAVFNGVYGNDIVNANKLQEEDLISGTNNLTQVAFDNYYRDDRPSTTYPRLKYNGSNASFTSMIIEDGSFLRMSLLTMGYNFKMPKGATVRRLGVNLTARNLFTLTEYSGYDPEVSTFANNPMRVGIDWASYPNNRSFTLGVSLSF